MIQPTTQRNFSGFSCKQITWKIIIITGLQSCYVGTTTSPKVTFIYHVYTHVKGNSSRIYYASGYSFHKPVTPRHNYFMVFIDKFISSTVWTLAYISQNITTGTIISHFIIQIELQYTQTVPCKSIRSPLYTWSVPVHGKIASCGTIYFGT